MAEKRNTSIDFIKGILILSVVIGHILLGSPEDNMLRYIIYSVHMPLFIGISGYLLRYEKIKDMSFTDLIKKYFFRVGIPWIIAVNIYFLYNNIELLQNLENLDAGALLNEYLTGYIKPYLHLWYVPAFLLYVFLTWGMIRLAERYWSDKKDVYIVLGITASVISIVSFYNRLPSIKLYYFIFFVLGMLAKELICGIEETKKLVFQKRMLALSMLFLTGRILLFFTEYELAQQVSLYYYVLNIPLLALLILGCEARLLPKCRIIEFLGRESLAVYLWHMLGKNIVVDIIGREEQLAYYLLNVLVFLLEMILIYAGKKVKFVDHFIFGNVSIHRMGRREELANAQMR